MEPEIRLATPDDIRAFFEIRALPKIIDVYGLFADGEMVAVSGIAPDQNYVGSWIDEEAPIVGFIDISRAPPDLGVKILRSIRRYLKTKNYPIYAQQDVSEPKSERILRCLGFEPTDETLGDKREAGEPLRMWKKWPSSEH